MLDSPRTGDALKVDEVSPIYEITGRYQIVQVQTTMAVSLSVINVLDQAGAVQNEYDYDAFGNAITEKETVSHHVMIS